MKTNESVTFTSCHTLWLTDNGRNSLFKWYENFYSEQNTILKIGTDRSQQIVQAKIRLLQLKQSDKDIHYLPFHLHLLDAVQGPVVQN